MATFDRLYSEQVLWDVRKVRGRTQTFPVRVLEINTVKGEALVSVNNNPARWVGERVIKSYRVKRPQPKRED